MKVKLWQAEVMENSCMHSDTLAKRSTVKSEKYAAVLFILIKKFENRFQYLKKKEKRSFFLYICNSIFRQQKSIICKLHTECIELQPAFNSKKNSVMSLCQTFISPLSREKYPSLHGHIYSCHQFLTIYTFVNNYCHGWSTGKEIFHQKSQMNTLRTHEEWQPLP